jgi:hypothetical protein
MKTLTSSGILEGMFKEASKGTQINKSIKHKENYKNDSLNGDSSNEINSLNSKEENFINIMQNPVLMKNIINKIKKKKK